MDDLEKGLYVTVVESDPVEAVMMGCSEKVQVGKYAGALYGEVLRIEALALPYLAMTCLSQVVNEGRTFELDSRKIKLMKLDDEYVRARRIRPPWWKFWKWGQ